MPFERLADNLARIRKVRDLSQEQLALAAGVGVDTVARIEQGRRTTCRPETLRNLALALEVNEEALLGMAGRLGHPDLAWSAGERALRAAAESDDPTLGVAISLRYLAWVLVRQRRFEEAQRVAVAAAERIQPAMLDRDPKRAGVYGNLLFNAASAALFAGRAQYAEDLLHEARAAATRAGVGYADEAAIFGPRVAAIQRIEHAAHADDPEQVLRLAQTLPAGAGRAPAFWEAGHRLRLASAATECCRYRDALTYLAQARELAPDWVRHQPLGAKTMRQLVDRATRRRGPEFSQLALHYNVSDY